ncbi:hypothetical protein M422DRAFT_273851 [Sphaerobolus stellatus SS14]|uniref:Uncharacterized protein n=1 Tax=Sphaerobolus stellatus (strain SS14) TaxID=990650 RepID=A0A0C9UIY4_SPHS4|nr:hypothetical protein M422DRAFT_273851 [Sphaerobolus stellatus SS14]
MAIHTIITTPMPALKTLKLHNIGIQEGIITPFQECFMPNLTVLVIETNALTPPDALVDLVLVEKLPSIRTITIDANVLSYPPDTEEEQRIRNRVAIAIAKLAPKDVSLGYGLAYVYGSSDSDSSDADEDIYEGLAD